MQFFILVIFNISPHIDIVDILFGFCYFQLLEAVVGDRACYRATRYLAETYPVIRGDDKSDTRHQRCFSTLTHLSCRSEVSFGRPMIILWLKPGPERNFRKSPSPTPATTAFPVKVFAQPEINIRKMLARIEHRIICIFPLTIQFIATYQHTGMLPACGV